MHGATAVSDDKSNLTTNISAHCKPNCTAQCGAYRSSDGEPDWAPFSRTNAGAHHFAH